MKLNQERNILIVSLTLTHRGATTDSLTVRGGLLQGYVIKSEDSRMRRQILHFI